jgi:hypothetical protein
MNWMNCYVFFRTSEVEKVGLLWKKRKETDTLPTPLPDLPALSMTSCFENEEA